MKRPKILLADDHAIVVDGLRAVLEPAFEVVGRVEDGRALVTEAERLRPDVIVADVSMPLLNGIEAARQIAKVDARIKVVFLTMHPDADLATEAFRAGAAGYVVKSSAAGELKAAILEVLEGRIYITPRIAKEVLGALMRPNSGADDPYEALTARQREVLQLIAEGRTSKEIANILNVSAKTVEFHKGRIKESLGLRTIAELAQYAMKRRIVAE
jgi:DNA-binding NarL/FixJ family response regulator